MQTENRQAVLRINQIKVLVERDALAKLLHLQQLALNHLLREFNQESRIRKLPLAALYEKTAYRASPGQYALRVPHCVFAAGRPRRVWLINDVVVDECRSVNDFPRPRQVVQPRAPRS